MRPFITLIVLCLALAACNTVHGIGRDLSAAGNAISGN